MTTFFFDRICKHAKFASRPIILKDPTENQSYLSALICDKCDKPNTAILPDNPLDQESYWRCSIHKSIQMESKLAQQLAIDLQIDLYSGGLITTINNLETKIGQLGHFLHSNHGLLLAAKEKY